MTQLLPAWKKRQKACVPHCCELPIHTQYWNDAFKTYTCPECGARWEEYFEEDYGGDEGGFMAWEKVK
jgi:hypothetical protein